MKKTTYQIPEIRDEKDNIIQSGTYGKNSPLCNETNDGVLDYINNNLEYLRSTQDSVKSDYFSKSGGRITGDTEIETQANGQYNSPLTIQVPDLKDGEGVYLNLGKEGSTNNRFRFGFEYQSSGNTANAFSIGADSGPHYTFDAVGNANFPKSLTAPIVNASTLNISEGAYVPTANADNNSKTVANTAFVQTAIANLVGSAPATLNTLQELSTALGNDANFSATVAKQIGEKVSTSGDTITGPILYSKTPNDDAELPNKAYVDSAIKSAVEATKSEVDNKISKAHYYLNRNTAYKVGDIAYSPNLPSYLYLECTTAGTTGATEPDMSTVSGGVIVNDGTVQFSVKTVCAKEYVDSRFNNEKAVPININNRVGTSYVDGISCYKAGHVVEVTFTVLKIDTTGSVDDPNNHILTGFPRPLATVPILVCPLNSNAAIRGALLPNGRFGWHYISAWQTTGGREATVHFTYLTND